MNQKKLLLFLVVFFCASVHAELPDEFKKFPEASRPENVALKIIRLYVNSSESTTPVTYPEVCSWFGALRFAKISNDKKLLEKLENRFIPILGENSGAMQTPNHVDNTVFGVIPLQLYMQTKKEAYYDIGIDFADRQWIVPANPSPGNAEKYRQLSEKGLSWQTRFWIDDMFMITAIQSQAFLASGDVKYINRAAHEMVAYLDSLQRSNGLFYHHQPDAPFFWGRGNGWMAVGMADLLTYLPEDNPNRLRILKEYRKMMNALKNYRNEEGIWNQLIDDPDAWTETSGSAMFTYAMITGVKNGWLDVDEYASVVRKAWLALVTYMNENGALRNVCVGTNIGNTKQYYLDRNRVTGDRHGQAAMLWCALALYDTDSNHSVVNLSSLDYDHGVLSPAFHPEITEYTCYTCVGENIITPIITTPFYGSKVTGTDPIDIDSGSTSSTITVFSMDELKNKTYTVNFVRGNYENYTDKILNNDFDLAPDPTDCSKSVSVVPEVGGFDGWLKSDGTKDTAWRPKNSTCKQFYGWTCDLSLTGSTTSQGINTDATNKHGDWVCWVGGNRSSYTEFELSQTINDLPAGMYKVQCLFAVGSGNKKNNQRVFANNNVQYYGSSSDYQSNLVSGENYTFAGHTLFEQNRLAEMMIYVDIKAQEALKIGIRTSNKLSNGNTVKQESPMFKVDYFRLLKVDPIHASNANLAQIILNVGELNFLPQTFVYNVLLPAGTETVTAMPVPVFQDAVISGGGNVDVSSGSGVSSIVITSPDGSATNTYTINYKVDSDSGEKTISRRIIYSVIDNKLTVKGTNAYTVYNIHGIKIADVKTDGLEATVDLMQGVYIVKTKEAKTFKIIV